MRLADFGDERLAGMAKAGLDVQVLSLSTPGVQNLASADAVALQTAANDTLAEAIRARPGSFQGLATLATPRPAAAAAELERAVTELGLNGAMLFGRTRDRNMDEPAFWPIYEAAAALKAPLHLHPQSPPAAVRGAYYSGYGPRVDAALATHGIGWHYDSGVQVLRLILSGVFDRFPDLRVIVGHWGEMVLFYLDRIDSLNELVGLRRPVSDYFRTNIFLAPSGILSRMLPEVGDRGGLRRPDPVLDGLPLRHPAAGRGACFLCRGFAERRGPAEDRLGQLGPALRLHPALIRFWLRCGRNRRRRARLRLPVAAVVVRAG